jgi:hypothetical protein
MTENPIDQFRRLAAYVAEADNGLHLKRLVGDVEDTLAVPGPKGVPGLLSLHGRALGLNDGLHADRVAARAYLDETIPQMWLGLTAVSAGQAMAALDEELGRIVDMGDDCAAALKDYAAAIELAQETDRSGRVAMVSAQDTLALIGFPRDFDYDLMVLGRDTALEGIEKLTTAAFQAQEAARKLVGRLGQITAEAHLARLKTNSLTGVDKLTLTAAAVPAGTDDLHPFNVILTADAAGRASDRLDGMTPQERRDFDGLLARAKSPQERAYLLQMLAAGHSLAEVETFDRKIHGHGDDPGWLRDHLTPAFTQSSSGVTETQFDGRAWNQSNAPTCVPATTILAHARIDPAYALDLTTGGHPDDPAFDNGDAFHQRLTDEQARLYGDGRSFLEDWAGVPGVGDAGKAHLADAELGDATGGPYELHGLDTPADRRTALPDVETAVDQGIPVQVTVQDANGSHELLVIDHDGDRLEVYNPWGYTTWIKETDFIDGTMQAAGPGVPSTVDDVTVPTR